MVFGIGISRRRHGGARYRARLLVQSLSLALVVPVGVAQVAEAAGAKGPGRPDVPESRVSKVEEFDGPGAKKAREQVAREKKANAAQAARARTERKAVWPGGGAATLTLAAGKSRTVDPGGLAVTMTPSPGAGAAAAGTVRVTALDQTAARKAGVTGVLLTAEAESAGTAEVRVDYSGFASVIGGGWSQRLSVVQMPTCALTTPQKPECRTQKPLPSDNDTADESVSAKVGLGGATAGKTAQLMRAAEGATSATVLAVTASSAGSGQSPNGAGDFSATPLSESSSWQAGGSSGSFTWSYGFTVPPAAAGPAPGPSLTYDSGSVDGRTATTNNQGSAVGEGFTLTDSYVERSYDSCDDDGHTDVFDQCWKYDNARLVLNGKASRLVKDDGSGQWRLENDDASKVTRSSGADNGDDNGEYWTVTTGDGTKYVFGLDKLTGADTQRTNSVWTVPVFGDDSGEPGYAAGDAFADRALTQAWRWNLDHVEDTRGNAATYWYTKESNYYKKNKATTANASYTRGGYLTRIEYGLRAGALFTDKADAKVTFSHAERCTASDCSSLTKDTADNWPDVPFDAICSSGDDECNAAGPSFFSRKRLTGIDTFSYNATTSAYDAVDSWDLVQDYLDGGDIGDSSDQVLTLKSLKRTGKAGDTSITANPVSFTYQMRPNRVDATDNILPLTRPRVSTITSETGAITTVTLSGEECVRSEVLGAAPDSNTRSCYPQFWNINGSADASIDWFHKYRVLAVTVSDPAAANETVEHAYSYSGAAWHYNDEPFTPADERTWSDWRGYRQVTAWTGATDVTRSRTVSLYLQGMHGDKNKDGTTKSVTVSPLTSPALGATALTDSDEYAGQLREQVTYDGSTAISATVNDPWSKETAHQTVPGAGDHVARYVRTAKTHGYTYLTASQTWRERQTATTFDSYGMPVTFEDSGQVGKADDETCTRTWYARNADAGLTSLVSRTRTVARTCATADTLLAMPATMDPANPVRGNVLADTATVYDTANATTWSATQTPTKGQVTWTGRATGYAVTADSAGERFPSGWQTVARTTYDTLGRPLTVTNTKDETVSTAYIPVDSGPLTRIGVTGPAPKLYKSYQYFDPRRGLSTRTFDINSKKTESTYDALGRLTAVWQPDRNRANGDAANATFAYHLDNTKPSWVSTSTLKNDGKTYNTGYALYDSLLRPLQTQSPTPQGGRLLTDTRYDTRGLAYETYADIFDGTSTPNGTYTRAEYGQTPAQSQTVFDGAGRSTTSTLYVYGVKKWSTTTSYTGDSVATTALDGASAARTITDVRGQTIENREYTGTSPADTSFGTGPGASYTSTKFAYEPDGKQKSITGPDGAVWSYVYDLFGRQAKATDPDRGTTTTAYDGLDRAVKVTDARGISLLTKYDELSRVTGTWKNSETDANQLTGYTYDTLLKGQPSSSTRYVGGKTGSSYTQAVTAYDNLSRPLGTELQLPPTDPFVTAGQPSKLAFQTSYNVDGTLQTATEPALGRLPSEPLQYSYDGLGNPTGLAGSAGMGYLRGVAYSALTQPQQLTLGLGGAGNKDIFITNTYEEGTGRLKRSNVKDQTHSYNLQDLDYTYDEAGKVTAISDSTSLGGSSSTDTQCFAYDGHQRLIEAWTPSSQKCEDARSAVGLSGPGPYWTSYGYNDAGQRTSETAHKTGGDTKTTYCYIKPTQPHTLTGTTTGTDCTTPQRSYGYDATGNTTSRPGATVGQTLLWSEEGKLSKLTENGRATDYLYDAAGNLLIRSTQNGERVLYAGASELHLRADGTTWAQRYYSTGGITTAFRSNQSGTNKLTYLAGDHHGTSSLAINADAAQGFTKRYTTPFGADRGTPLYGPWPDDKGFLGKTRDTTTGLTHVGAREYDPVIGQFISVDPILAVDQPQSLNGYSYANNNPVNGSDPTGLWCDSCNDGSGWDRPDGGTTGDPDGGKNSDGTVRGTPHGGGGSGGTARANDGGSIVTDLGKGQAPPLQEDLSKAYLGGDGIPSLAQMQRLGTYMPHASLELNYELYFRERCTFSQGTDMTCKNLRDYYGGWKHVQEIESKDTCPICGNVGFGIILEFAITRGGKVSCWPPNSFLPGEEVLLADGSSKRIEDVEVGEKVLATDPESGETEERTVTATIVSRGDKNLVKISIDVDGKSGDRTASVTATEGHPFWAAEVGAWIDAGDLRPGQWLRTNADTMVQISAIKRWTQQASVHNLSVDKIHTYYVLAGVTPVLVHNCNNLPGDSVRFPGQAHTLDEHVNVSRQQATALAVRKGGPNGVFFDAQTAQQVVDYGLAGNAKRINSWLRGSERQLTIKGSFGANNSIGWAAHPDGRVTPTGNQYTMVLQRQKGHAGGYFVLTAYPR
ncbi:RHS repeat-associated core domain-containing protein [Streptomyces sp. NPDC014882]|uniref:RHS repeat-associated core domain-containing protein n=1 Tax=Streptomyces sp. NPDC014882 TaxID=3364927 RepID=UPI0036FA748C